MPGSAPPCKTWKITSGACVREATRLPQVRQIHLHLRHALLEFAVARGAVSPVHPTDLRAWPVRLPSGRVGRRARVLLALGLGRSGPPAWSAGSCVVQFGRAARSVPRIQARGFHPAGPPPSHGACALRATPPGAAPTAPAGTCPLRPVTAGVLALSWKPVAGLEPPFFDRCSQVVSDLLIGGPRVAGIRHGLGPAYGALDHPAVTTARSLDSSIFI